jgi:hypothetical protein
LSDPRPERISYSVFALSDLEDPKYQPLRDAVMARLAEFDCSRSTHLQTFARKKVHDYESHGHSRTYVLVSPDDDEGIDVPAFFTVGMTSLDYREVSGTMKKKLNGNITVEHTGAYAIAELARSDRYTKAQLPGEVILDEAKEIIRQSRQLIAGRFLVVDAQEKVFEALYKPAGFSRLAVAEAPKSMPDGEFVTGCCVIKDW